MIPRITSSLVAEELRLQQAAAELERIRQLLRTFYNAPLSISSLQPVLDLALSMNPDLRITALARAETPAGVM
jgi:hypothetical protein